MLKGLLKHLTSSEGSLLRQNFIFRVVPILNVDGVVHGNYRCSQLGCDLNRRWDNPNRLLHPAIYYSFQMIKMLRNYNKIQAFVDFHGHSKKTGVFFYGGTFMNFEHEGRPNNAFLRIIPLLCCQKNKFFALKSCRFHLDKKKGGSARHVVFTKLGVLCSFTLEASFFGYKNGHGRGVHFSIEDFESCGRTVLESFYHYLPGQQHGLFWLV